MGITKTKHLAIIFIILVLAAATYAQVSIVAGTLSGVVQDSAGAVVPQTRITLRNIDTGQTRVLLTNENGDFLASELPAGTYELSAEHDGFATYRHSGLIVLVGRAARFTVVLQPATVEKTLTVTSQPDALEPTQTTVVTNVETERIEELPVQSRNYLNFVLLAPGVSSSQAPQQSSGGQAALGLSDSGFSFGGLRGRSNNIAIDGVDNNEEFTGASRTELSLEIVREFQVVNTGISAESGGASGGAINVVTKSGANNIHGDAFLFLQNAATNARDPLTDAGQYPAFDRYRAGFAIGGPVRKNKTFYYLAGEQEHARIQESSDIDSASRATINSVLSSGAYPELNVRSLNAGLFDTSRAETEISGKLDHQLSNSQSLMLRYAFTNNREAGSAFNTGSLVDRSARGSFFSKDNALVASLTSVISPQFLNDLRFQVARRSVVQRTNDQSGPGIDIAGTAIFGRPFSGNGHRTEDHYQFVDSATLSRGSHLLKFGATANHVSLDAAQLDGFGGVYIFPTLSDFVAGTPQMRVQGFGDPKTNFAVTSYGGFLQDHWTPRWSKRLTLDLGVRYDFEQLPTRFRQDYNNISPRLGLSFTPAEKWVLRAAYGIYFDRYVLAFLNRAEQLDGQHAFLQVAESPLIASAVQANVPSIYAADPHLATPYSQQVSAGVERLITTNTTVSATYQFVRGIKLPRTLNVNLPPPTILTAQNAPSLGFADPLPQLLGRPVFGPTRLDPAYDNIYQLQDRASSTYNGLVLAVNHRLAHEVAFTSSYTWSKTIDDASDFDEQPQNAYDLRAERALSRNDQRHRFVFSGLFDLPVGDEEDRKPGTEARESVLSTLLGNIEFAPILSLASGIRSNPLVGFDANRNGSPLSSRPLGYARNSLRSPAEVNLEVRIVKFFNVKPHGKLDFVFEMFNVLNRSNIAATNPVFGPGVTPVASFATPIELRRPRQAQFSIDFEF